MKQYEYILSYGSGLAVTTETLTVNPAGWDEVGVQFERNWTYMSVLRNITRSLRFANVTGGGYSFLKSAYDSQGIYAIVTVTINKRNPENNKYEFFYSGIVDFKPNGFVIERNYIEAPIVDNETLQKFKDRDELELNLKATETIDGVAVTPFSAAKTISLTPVDITLSADFVGDGVAAMGPAQNIDGKFSYIAYLRGDKITYAKNELGDLLIVGTTEDLLTNPFDFEIDVYVKLTGEKLGNGTINNDSLVNAYELRVDTNIQVLDSGGGIIFTWGMAAGYEKDVPATQSDTFNMDIKADNDYTFTVPAGGKLIFYNRWRQDNANNANIVFVDLSEYRLQMTALIAGDDATNCECLFPFEAFTRGLQLLTSRQNAANILDSKILGRTDSDFVQYGSDGEYSKDAIFNGRMVRQYPNEPLTVKFKDLFLSFRNCYNIGMGYNSKFYIEDITTFFDGKYVMFELGQVANFKRYPLPEGYFNKILAGYKNKGDYENLQGAYEFAINREYSTPAPVKEEKNLESEYRRDSIGIEFARKKPYFDSGNEDYRDDNAIFIVRTDGTEPVLQASPLITGFAGVDTYYNTMLTPRQNLIRNGSLIAPTLFRNNGEIKLQQQTKNITLVIDGADENSDITKTELGTPLFNPEVYEFDQIFTREMMQILLENPHGLIKFVNFGETLQGFVMRIETKKNNNEATFTLIAK